MPELIVTMQETLKAEEHITSILRAHGEWLFFQENGRRSTALVKDEIHLHTSQKQLVFSCWTETGVRTWRIHSWDWNREKLVMQASRRTGAERATLTLIPRASASAIAETIRETRKARCAVIGRLACAVSAGAKIERLALSAGVRAGEPGRYARVLLRLPQERIAVTGPAAVIEPRNVDAFLSSALIWLNRLTERLRPPFINKLWLVVPPQCRETLGRRIPLLRESLQRIVSIYEIDDEWQKLNLVGSPDFSQLWDVKPRSIRRPPKFCMTESAERILSIAPDAIDIVRAGHGETLRYHGLPFARVRRVMKEERVWFGIDRPRRLLEPKRIEEWEKLLDEIRAKRAPESQDKRNMLYRTAAEAWLESLLRRDITQLDPGMVIAPIHAQFRASDSKTAGQRPIDLLALRRDGRLVVIELKVTEDREHVLQGVSYWRQVEAHRRCGNITAARLFGDAGIEDEPPLVYLAAPALSFHRAFRTLSKSILREVEIFRFDINEDWRTGVRVARRERVN